MAETFPTSHEIAKPESNLPPKWQEYVRTPEFKEWFGDWENDPESASKMVDENSEPMMLYFGGRPDIKQFSHDRRERTGADEIGLYSTTKKRQARAFAQSVDDPQAGKPAASSVYSLFINARNPYYPQKGDGVHSTRVFQMPAGHDAIINTKLQEVVVGDPDQIRIVDEEPVNLAPSDVNS